MAQARHHASSQALCGEALFFRQRGGMAHVGRYRMDRMAGGSAFGTLAPGRFLVRSRTRCMGAEIALCDGFEQCRQVVQRHLHKRADVHPSEGDRQRFGLEPLAVAGRARFALHEPGYALSHQRALGIGEGVQHIPPGAGEGAHVARLHLAFERGAGFGRRETGVHRHRWCFLGEQNPVAILFRQVLPRPVNVVAHADQDVAQVLALPGGWPGSNRPLTDAQGGVGHHERLGHLVHMTQAVAGRARPLRRVRRKILGVQHWLVGGIGAGARIHHPHQAGQGGHTAHGGTRIAGPPLLLQRHRWWQAVDRIYVRHARLVDQAPCIGGHRLKIASLCLGIDGAEGQRGLPGAGDTREHHQRIPRDRDVHLFEVVLARATHLHEAAGRSGTRGFTERIAWHVLIL